MKFNINIFLASLLILNNINCAEVKESVAEYSELLKALSAPIISNNAFETSDVLNDLIKKTENINAQDASGRSALHWAVENNNIDAVNQLLQCPNIDFNLEDNDGYTPLSIAVVNNNLEAVIILLKNPKIIVNNRIYKNKKNILEKLKDYKKIEYKERMNLVEAKDFALTPLMLAAKNENHKIIELLLIAGADPTAQTMELTSDRGIYKTILNFVKEPSDLIKSTIEQWNNGAEKLIDQIKDCKIEFAKILIKNFRVSVNYAIRKELNSLYSQKTPLYWAITNKIPELVKLLIESNATFNKFIEYQNTLTSYLHLAVKSNNKEIVNILLDACANPNIVGENDRCPIIASIGNESTDITKILLDANADVDYPDKNENYPLDHAVNTGSIPMVNLLLEYKANVNSPGILDRALKRNIYNDKTNMFNDYAKILQSLIDAGAVTHNNSWDYNLVSIRKDFANLLEKDEDEKKDN